MSVDQSMGVIVLLFLTPTFLILIYVGIASLLWPGNDVKPKFVTPEQLIAAHQRRSAEARLRMYRTMDRMDERS